MLAEKRPVKNPSTCGELYELLLSDEFEKLEFYVGGTPGPNHRVLFQPLMDGSCLVQYAGANTGRLPSFEENLPADADAERFGRLLILSRPAWRRMARLLDRCEVLRWDHRYLGPHTTDEKQWYLDIAVIGRRRICRAGSNAFPPPWERLIDLLQHEVDGRIR